MFLSKLTNVYDYDAKCICFNCKIYLSKGTWGSQPLFLGLCCWMGGAGYLYWQAGLRNNLPSSWHLTLATPIIRQSMITHSLLTFSSYSSLQRIDIHHKTNHNHHIHHDLPFFRSWQNTLVLHGVKQEANCGYESSECTDAKVLD